MKSRILSFMLIACIAVACTTEANQTLPPQSLPAAAVSGQIIKRGENLSISPLVSISALLKDPKQYEGKTVIVEGVAERVCAKKGCWMELVPKSGEPGMRVTFKNYGFFVPTDSKGMKVKAEGQISVKVLSKDDADHLAGEGARLKRNPDGTANEISFVATGVELQK
jgi:hypothetical protein